MIVKTKAEMAAYIAQLEQAIERLVPAQPKAIPKIKVRPSLEQKGWFDLLINDTPRVAYKHFMDAQEHAVRIRKALH